MGDLWVAVVGGEAAGDGGATVRAAALGRRDGEPRFEGRRGGTGRLASCPGPQ
jgi:hypothetical protein